MGFLLCKRTVSDVSKYFSVVLQEVIKAILLINRQSVHKDIGEFLFRRTEDGSAFFHNISLAQIKSKRIAYA